LCPSVGPRPSRVELSEVAWGCVSSSFLSCVELSEVAWFVFGLFLFVLKYQKLHGSCLVFFPSCVELSEVAWILFGFLVLNYQKLHGLCLVFFSFFFPSVWKSAASSGLKIPPSPKKSKLFVGWFGLRRLLPTW